MNINLILSEWVTSARKSANLSGEQLGAKLAIELGIERGHTKGNISHWETGKHQPNISQLLAIRSITGMELPKEIIGNTNNEFNKNIEISPAAQCLINAIIKAETSGSSSPKLIEALSKVLDVALPSPEPDANKIRDLASFINQSD